MTAAWIEQQVSAVGNILVRRAIDELSTADSGVDGAYRRTYTQSLTEETTIAKEQYQ